MVANEVANNWVLLNKEILILEDAYDKVDILDRYEFLFDIKDSIYFRFYEDRFLKDYYEFKSSKSLKKSLKRKIQTLKSIKNKIKTQRLTNYIIDFRSNIKLFVSKILFFNNDEESDADLFSANKIIKLINSVTNKLAINETHNIRLTKYTSF